MLGTDPQVRFHDLWIVQLVLFFLLLPLAWRVMRRGVKTDPFDISKRRWRVLYGLLVYYAVHFYVFMAVAAQELRGEYTWRMFSAGWLLLFSLTSLYYWTRFRDTSSV
jgi:hypothetical protein